MLLHSTLLGFSDGSDGKLSAYNAGDPGSIPGLGRSPGEGKGYPLQCSGLENSMDCIVHGVAKSRTWLSNFHWLIILVSGVQCSDLTFIYIINWHHDELSNHQDSATIQSFYDIIDYIPCAYILHPHDLFILRWSLYFWIFLTYFDVNSPLATTWIFIGRTDVEAETTILWPPDAKNWLTGKDPDAGKD